MSSGASFSTLDCVGPVRAAIDESALLSFLRHERIVPAWSRVTIEQFHHGQSNPTFLISLEGSSKLRMVLRKKPAGTLLPSAHAVEREYAVIAALHGHAVPVPRPICMCNDTSVLGTPFYMMEFAEGTIFLVGRGAALFRDTCEAVLSFCMMPRQDPNLPDLSPTSRQHVYQQMALTLARLHSAKPDEIGLASFGSATSYCARQVGWIDRMGFDS